jgi:hypothetical protein
MTLRRRHTLVKRNGGGTSGNNSGYMGCERKGFAMFMSERGAGLGKLNGGGEILSEITNVEHSSELSVLKNGKN